jgi:hypothetical protein
MSAERGAERLRQAAALMRSRAEAATPGHWQPFGTSIGAETDRCNCHGGIEPYGHEQYCGIEGPIVHAHETDVEHIAAFATPGVALTVADWLDRTADQGARLDALDVAMEDRAWVQQAALAVADAYLGSAS